MCRSIKTLFNFEPPATEAEIRAASIQFDRAVDEVTAAARSLITALVTNAEPRDREIEAARARARGAARFNVQR